MNKHRKALFGLMCLTLGLLSLTACGKNREKASEPSSEAAAETWVTLDENSPAERYEPYPLLLQICTESSAEGWEQAPPSAFGLSDALADPGRPWGYGILDLDGDGTEEFVIGLNETDRTRLINVFTVDARGVLTTQFCSDGTKLLSITREGEWIIDDGEHDRIDGEPGTREGEQEEGTAEAEEIRWMILELTALQDQGDG